MVLYLKEFQEQDEILGEILNYYDKLPEYLHEMSVKDIMKHINRNGVRSWYLQQKSVLEYFMWLHNNYGIDMTEKNYQLKQIRHEKSFVGFYDLDDLRQGISQGLVKAEDENNATLPDYSGLKAIFFLEWYGVLPESAVTIQLTDVSVDGKEVYVPAKNRTIEIDDSEVAEYFAEYKAMTGFVKSSRAKSESPYRQKTFYRNTSGRGEITVKTIYNIKLKFLQGCEDLRFEKRRVYYSGRYFQMFKSESELGREFSASDAESCEIIQTIFNNNEMSPAIIATTLREYRVYKAEYLERLS